MRPASTSGGVALRRDLAEEPQGVGFVAPFLVRPGELQGPLRLGRRLVQPAGQQIRLAQPDHPERMVEHETHRDGLLDRLLQQRQGLGGPSGERIGRPQGRGDPGDEEPDVRPLREVEGPFEHGDGLGEVALAQRPKAHGPIRHGHGCRGDRRPRQSAPLPLRAALPSAKAPHSAREATR